VTPQRARLVRRLALARLPRFWRASASWRSAAVGMKGVPTREARRSTPLRERLTEGARRHFRQSLKIRGVSSQNRRSEILEICTPEPVSTLSARSIDRMRRRDGREQATWSAWSTG
jgi:hypothetical protein